MPTKPPAASGLSKLLATLADASTRLTPARAWGAILTAFAATFLVDHLTGPQFSLGVVYVVIGCFAAWCLGERAGLALGLGSVVITAWINGFGSGIVVHGRQLSAGAIAWNMGGRLLSTALLITLASGLRCALDQARWRASTDGLTGALNKATFTRQMEMLVARARSTDAALVVAYIDLDGFKAINDTQGHAAGDALLCRFAEAATGAIRGDDLFARVGGDEFMALLNVENTGQGDTAAERLHARLGEILRIDGQGVTCSTGALIVESRKVTHIDMLIDAADGLMYEVKRAGKDSIRIARDDLQPVSRLRPRRPVPHLVAERAA